MCKCLPSKCDCNPLAEDPDSFCSGDDVCKVGGILSTYLQCTYLHIYISVSTQDCVCQPRYPPGCTCDPFSPDPDSSCPGQQTCKQCKCLGEWFIVSTVQCSRVSTEFTCLMSPWDSSCSPLPSVKPHIRSPHIFCVLSGAKLLPFATSSSQPFVFQRYNALHCFIYAILGTKIESLSHLCIQERQ